MHGGCLLIADIPSLVGLTPDEIASILREEDKRFPEPEPGTVMVQSPVRLCSGYLANKCQATDCGRLHLCRYFILGHCFFRGDMRGRFCRCSHDIRSEGNRAVMKANGISSLREKELRALLQLNDPSCLPEVCYEYKGDKMDVPCHKAEACHRLHVCQHFLRGQCRYFRCNRSHNLLDASAFKVMQRHGLSEELINNVQLLRMHQCKEARLESRKWEWPKENKDKGMIQKNLAYGTEKEVRRRRFVSMDDIDRIKEFGGTNIILTRQLTSSGQTIPCYWDGNAVPEVGYKLVQINRYSMEFHEIEESFELTMPNHSIQKVQRIQNGTLWKFYEMQKETMKKQNRRDVLEKKLFHGTNKTHLHAICRNNFDWRIYGAHGTKYGKGSYFARDASFSDRYCDSNSSSKSMFLARVLVGDFVRGYNHYTRPPPRNYTQDTFYDSCVNKDHDPSIFVIFEKHQIYPEYIIEYCKNNQR